MSRRHPLRPDLTHCTSPWPWGVLLVLLSAQACTPGESPEEAPPAVAGFPNIVIVTIDTLRADHVGWHGYFRDTTPNLDRLADESIVFERCLAPMATTLPTHTSLFTGVWPLEHGIIANLHKNRVRFERADKLIMFAEYMQGLGYRTVGIPSALPLKKRFGMDTGFTTYPGLKDPVRIAPHTSRMVQRLLADPDPKPLFLWVHYFDPHSPYEAPEAFNELFQADEQVEAYIAERQFVAEATRPTGQVNEVREGIDTYDAEIRFTDEHLGSVLDTLRDTRWWDDTIVLVVADHGEGLNQHAEPGHGLVWWEQLHVPCILRVPGVEPRRFEAPMSIIDLLPTLLGFVALPDEERFLAQVSGADVFADDFEPRAVFAQTSKRQEEYGGNFEYSLTTREWRFMRTDTGVEQLFRFDQDPFELSNVLAEHPEVAERFRTELAAEIESQRARGAALGAGRTEELSEGDIDGLKALGYGGGDEDEETEKDEKPR